MAYTVLIEHTLAERDRSPAVVPRCVELLKRYLLRYIPKVQTLRHIDHFCENSIVECDSATTNSRISLQSKSLSQQPGTSQVTSNAHSPSLHASNFASPSLVKSLSYVHSLVARHIPKVSFQLTQSGGSASSKQSLTTLSALLSKSFTSHISPEVVSSKESPQRTEGPVRPPSNLRSLDDIDRGGDDARNISPDLLTWRWSTDREQQSSFFMKERSHGFLEVGAAALLVGDMDAKSKQRSWEYTANQDFPDIDQLLQPSTATMAYNIASSRSHLKAIAASKRLKPDPHQIWTKAPASVYHPRARPLFQYKHYSEQQPLRLNPAEISEVIAEVCSESCSSNGNLPSASSSLTNFSRRPPTDVAVSVLVKLVIDMYMMDSGAAAPLTLLMLEEILSSHKVVSRVRAFDLILNLGVHAHLLEPLPHEDTSIIEEDDDVEGGEEEAPQETSLRSPEQSIRKTNQESPMQQRMSSAIDKFETWLLVILFEILQFLVQKEEQEEVVWASALSCLFYFICDGGKILRTRLDGLDIRVIKSFLEISRKHSWAEIVRCRLVCMLTNMFYLIPKKSAETVSDHPTFLIGQVDFLGGIDFVCLEYFQANSREEKRNLFLVLVDYVLHQINDASPTCGASSYTYDEIQLVVSMLSLADAPEAFYIAVKHGLEGIGEILRRPISVAMSRSPNYERLDLLLHNVTRKLDATISMFTRLDNEFSHMIQITKSYRSFDSIEDKLGEIDGMKVKLAWATLHSLLHSERSACRHNGYIWLVELLLSEISEDRDRSIWENIRKLQEQIGLAGSQDSTFPLSVPPSINMLCGLLKSVHNYIRWGFLFVVDKLLVRLKLLLDESQLQNTSHGDTSFDHNESRLDKANAIIDIMSCTLSLVVQINETDSINILKMCDILFSQLCLRQQLSNVTSHGNFKCLTNRFDKSGSCKGDLPAHMPQTPQDKKNVNRDDLPGTGDSSAGIDQSKLLCETASMAALLLHGYAIVPIQLVAHVPASLFYWPLIQLAGSATDDIALDVAVGSRRGGNLPGAISDIRAALLLLLIGKCSADTAAFLEVEGEEFFRGLLDDTDSRVAYYSSAFLLKRMMTEQPERYQRMLQSLIVKAQQSNNEKLLENPYLQMCGILKLLSDSGA